MGAYTGYIATAYGVTALVIMGAIFLVWIAYRRARDQAAALESAIVERVAKVAPIALFAILALTLWFQLEGRKAFDDMPDKIRTGEPAPDMALPPLDTRTASFSGADLRTGQVTVVNVFASWCIPCRAEVPQLVQLKQVYGVRLLGMAYKDKPADARAFLDDYGNPYDRVGAIDGSGAIEWGIYKVPETFVIDGKGRIRGRFGPLDDESLKNQILPAIQEASRS